MARSATIKFGAGELVGAAEAAAILYVPVSSISRWVKAGKMPEPVDTLKATLVWLRSDIEAKRDKEDRRPPK